MRSTLAPDARAEMRRTVFLSDDGVLLCATLRALDRLDVLEPSLATDGLSLSDLVPELTPSGFGYLRAGIRSLVGQGWIHEEPTLDPSTTVLRWTDRGRAAAAHRRRYLELGEFLASFSSNDANAWTRPWTEAQQQAFLRLLDLCLERWGLDAGDVRSEVIAGHLDAGLVVPTLLSLRGTHRLRSDAPSLPDTPAGDGMARLLAMLGWLDEDGDWTVVGALARDYSVHFGIVGSYLPMLARLPELYRGEQRVLQPGQATEWHVNRELNVIASAAAHKRYFADADEILVELFDLEPLEDQPRFVADMGCGDGSWLVHLYRLIRERTVRGRHLDAYPVQMVGIDFSEAALASARRELAAAGVPALLLQGDIGDPDSLAAVLADHGLEMREGLHIRAFIDHDRTYSGDADSGIAVDGRSSGVYVDRLGRPLDAAAVERDLVAHLERWAPHVSRHGLVVLEAHCVAPAVARRHLGALHSVAFDAYHAYSHQYPIEYSAFVQCCREAGLERIVYHERHYPSTRPFVAVSLNRLVAERGSPASTWRRPGPKSDSEDGEGLHRLLFADGDVRHPRPWAAAPTGFVVKAALDTLATRLADARRGETIRVLDYGTGTGLAAIEFLKACREQRIGQRLAQRGVQLELHLVDLPSDWFAYGYNLLSDCPWTRFHSLRGPDGGFRRLLDLLDGERADAIMVSMVFHLIPPSALGNAVADLAAALAPGGRLAWSSPDLGPPGPYAVLFHDANRSLRARWLERGGGADLDVAARREARARADRRVLRNAQQADLVADALREHLTGDIDIRTYEMAADETLDALLVPSNQGEYLPEISDRAEREQVIRDLMLGEVLPDLQASPAGTARGVNVQWTLGDFVKTDAP